MNCEIQNYSYSINIIEILENTKVPEKKIMRVLKEIFLPDIFFLHK